MENNRKNISQSSRTYDVIFIGQLAAVVARHFYKSSSRNYRCLVINNTINLIEPSLAANNSTQIKIIKQTPQQCDLETKKILRIRPNSKQIQMEHDSVIYYYKYLVYTENSWANYDFIPTLRQALSSQYSLVYSNCQKSDISNIFKYNFGNLYFIFLMAGTQDVYGCNIIDQSFRFLQIYWKFINSNLWNNNNSFKCKVILQSTSFLPFYPQGDEYIKKQLLANDIDIIYNTKVTKIDFLRRILKLNDTSVMPYTIFYCILPQKIPKLLSQANIDPYYNHSKTLMNKKYKDIFIFGADLFPTTHSFTAINFQAHIIKHNLLNLLQKKSELTFYQGNSSIKFWLNSRQIITLTHTYNQSDQIPSKNCFDYLPFKQKILKLQVQFFYNLASDGRPYYLFSPNLIDYKINLNQHDQKQKHSNRGLKSNINIENIN